MRTEVEVRARVNCVRGVDCVRGGTACEGELRARARNLTSAIQPRLCARASCQLSVILFFRPGWRLSQGSMRELGWPTGVVPGQCAVAISDCGPLISVIAVSSYQ